MLPADDVIPASARRAPSNTANTKGPRLNQGLVGDTGIEPVTSSVSGKRAPAAPIARARWVRDSNPCARLCRPLPRLSANPPCGLALLLFLRADDGTRTRDPHLGKVMLYQLSHIRTFIYKNETTFRSVGDTGIEPVTSSVSGKRAPAAPIARARWVRDSNPCARLCRPLPRLSANPPCGLALLLFLRADDGTRTRDPHLGKVMLYQLSHIRMNQPAIDRRCSTTIGSNQQDCPTGRARSTPHDRNLAPPPVTG